MKEIIVQKFGGSSVAQPEQIRQIANNIHELWKSGTSVIAIVSAMGTSTDELVNLAYKVSDSPNGRELDMLLTTGERVTMSLLSMALHDLACPAISFTGSQAGVLTDSAHSNARIQDIKPIRVKDSLDKNQVVVLAGFQGVDPKTKEITTLGRGGSDTTAVAMAAHFKAKICQILKDVDGVFSADPQIIPIAKALPTITYEALSEMCFWGSKVMHYRSIELAKKLKIPLFIGNSVNPSTGTSVVECPEVNMYETVCVLSINSHEFVHHYQIDGEDLNQCISELGKFFTHHKIPWPTILAAVYENKKARVMLTASANTLESIAFKSQTEKSIRSLDNILSSVTATCNGATASELLSEIMDKLNSAKIYPEKVISSPLSLTVFVAPSLRTKTIEILHSLV